MPTSTCALCCTRIMRTLATNPDTCMHPTSSLHTAPLGIGQKEACAGIMGCKSCPPTLLSCTLSGSQAPGLWASPSEPLDSCAPRSMVFSLACSQFFSSRNLSLSYCRCYSLSLLSASPPRTGQPAPSSRTRVHPRTAAATSKVWMAPARAAASATITPRPARVRWK